MQQARPKQDELLNNQIHDYRNYKKKSKTKERITEQSDDSKTLDEREIELTKKEKSSNLREKRDEYEEKKKNNKTKK